MSTTSPTPISCSTTNSADRLGLRIGAIFIVLITSFVGTLSPILLKRRRWCPTAFFEFAKYFGSGVIIATAFIHLLAPAFKALNSPCLGGAWLSYDWAAAIAMIAVYLIFFIEFGAHRIGKAKMAKLNMDYDAVTRAAAAIEATSPLDPDQPRLTPVDLENDIKSVSEDDVTPEYDTTTSDGIAQLIAVAILEFGVISHSVFIGLTLAVNEQFTTLFVVIVFHQMFEGLGVGSRLSALRLPPNLKWAPYIASFLYSVTTPLGMAIGLAVSSSYNSQSSANLAVEGILDAISAGILLYTGLVELLAHEILHNPKMMGASTGKVTWIFFCMLSGTVIMAIIGNWA